MSTTMIPIEPVTQPALDPAKAELFALAYSTPELRFADIIDEFEALSIHVRALTTDERRTDGRRQRRAGARLVGQRADGTVTERYGPIDLRRLAKLLER